MIIKIGCQDLWLQAIASTDTFSKIQLQQQILFPDLQAGRTCTGFSGNIGDCCLNAVLVDEFRLLLIAQCYFRRESKGKVTFIISVNGVRFNGDDVATIIIPPAVDHLPPVHGIGYPGIAHGSTHKSAGISFNTNAVPKAEATVYSIKSHFKSGALILLDTKIMLVIHIGVPVQDLLPKRGFCFGVFFGINAELTGDTRLG